jgi:hypothetical protein
MLKLHTHTRPNKIRVFGWIAVLFALQAYLTETPVQRAKSSTGAVFTVGMALISVSMV